MIDILINSLKFFFKLFNDKNIEIENKNKINNFNIEK